MGFVLGDIGRHEDAQAATRRAIAAESDAVARARQPAQSSAQRAHAEKQTPTKRELQVSGEGQLARYNLGLAFRSKGYYAEALREYGVALERGEERDLVLQAMAEMHLLHAPAEGGAGAVRRSARRDSRRARSCGTSAASRCTRTAASPTRRRAIVARSTRSPSYAIAQNNLGVSLYHRGAADEAIDAFRTRARRASRRSSKARLNLALLLHAPKAIPAGARGVSARCLGSSREHPVAWNGVGLVLAELRKFEDARNAFARAIQARPDFAEAHYNMSFTLSNLGDFEGALRETKRALELDPYYVAQKFELAMDVEYEDPDLSIQPDLGGERRGRRVGRGLQLRSAVRSTRCSPSSRRRRRRRSARRRSQHRRVAVRDGDGLPVEGTIRPRVGGDQSRDVARQRARRRHGAARRRVRASRGCSARRSSGIAKRCGSIPTSRRAMIGEAWALVASRARTRGAADRRAT